MSLDFSKPPKWTEQAVCASVDPELFYPEQGGSTRKAIRICRTCPVASDCLAYAVSIGEREGIWGGVAPTGRRGMAA